MENRKRYITRNENVEAKHRRIFELYSEMLRQEREDNPERARCISKTYFAKAIAKDPLVSLQPDTVMKIILKQIKKCK